MTDPNQPYGAVPPPPPPPGAAPTGPPTGPPFPAPPGAGGSGSDKSGNALWITLAVVGVLALVGVIVGLILLLADDDEDKRAGKDPSSTSTSSSNATEASSSPTEASSPTDASTSASPADPSTSGGVIGGNSTADAVPNDPKSVVQAFLDSVAGGDCATAEDLVTEKYLEEEGNCDPKDIPSDFADTFKYTVGTPKVNDAAGTATVPVEVDVAGDKQTSDVELVKVGGLWRVDEF